MKKKLLSVFTLGLFAISSLFAANEYGIPEKVQDGNILQCFNWNMKVIKNNMADIAKAGYGSVQVSPLQRADVQSNWHWYDLYCPADIALMESSALGTKADLKALCDEAHKYGIKVIVDVVANHINWTNGYYNTWWEQNNRNRNGRSQPKIDSYSNRNNITQNRMGDYFEVNSESQEVINRAVDYVKELASYGVDGIRWDAAKHIALPSESQGGQFWASVTSCVPGMYHYGEILDEPVNGNGSLIKEYAKYMSVTDNRYSNNAARSNGGIPTAANGSWVNSQGLNANKLVYWAESHDTYSNDEWSQNVDQSVIDRAYAAVACRKGSTALYLARPNQKGYGNILIQKGTDAYKGNAVAQVNKFRNVMGDRADYFTNNGNACSITRKDGGAVIVMKGSGDISIANGGSYCPEGTYFDRVNGNKFTVTSSTISGKVGSTGIAVIYPEDLGEYEPGPDPDPDPTPNPNPTTWNIYFDNSNSNWSNVNVYAYSPEALGAWSGTAMVMDAASGYYKLTTESDLTGLNLIFNNGSGEQTGDNVTAVNNGIYTFTGNKSANGVYTGKTYEGGDKPVDPDPDPNPSKLYIIGNLEGCQWQTASSPALTATAEGFEGTFTLTPATGETKCFFSFTTALGADWNELNMAADRYGAATENAPAVVGQNTLTLYKNNVDASGCNSFGIDPGTYTFKVDLANLKLVISSGKEDPKDPDEEDPTDPEIPIDGTMYIIGNLEGCQWQTATSPALTATAKGFEGTFTLTPATGETKCFFSFTTALGADWNELNMAADRYGAATENAPAIVGQNTLTLYKNNVNASACNSFGIDPGKYTFLVDPDNLTLIISSDNPNTGVEGIEVDEDNAPIFFNLQGVRVDNPSKGIYIKVTGKKREKVYVR